jgi:hypothetical protein
MMILVSEQIWQTTPGDPMEVNDLISNLEASGAINGKISQVLEPNGDFLTHTFSFKLNSNLPVDEDLDYFKEQAGLVQDGIDPSPDGMINYEEWCVIWSNATLLALQDKVVIQYCRCILRL